MVKDTMVFIIKEVWDFFPCFFFSKSSFAAVSADKLTAAVKAVDCKNTVIRTAFTTGHSCLIVQVNNLIKGHHRGLTAFFISLPGN